MKTRIMGIMAIIAAVVGCKAQKNFASKKKPDYDYDLINYRKVYMGQCLPRAEYGVSYKKNIKIINNKIK